MTYDGESWLKRSRFLGAMRYHRVWLGRVIIWVLALLLAGNAVMICAALAGAGELHMNDLRASLSISMALLLVCACLASHSRTRFLLRFGTARFPVWLSNVLALFLGSAAFLLGTLAINLATGGAVQAFSYAMPGRFGLGEAGLSLRAALEALPQQLLWLLEWTSLFYLLGCCLRRRRGVTLAVILGVPFVCFMLMLMPFVSETTAALESGSEMQVMAMGLQWMQWLTSAARFAVEQWPWIQLGAAIVSLPLSYLCMRGTPQP